MFNFSLYIWLVCYNKLFGTRVNINKFKWRLLSFSISLQFKMKMYFYDLMLDNICSLFTYSNHRPNTIFLVSVTPFQYNLALFIFHESWIVQITDTILRGLDLTSKIELMQQLVATTMLMIRGYSQTPIYNDNNSNSHNDASTGITHPCYFYT